MPAKVKKVVRQTTQGDAQWSPQASVLESFPDAVPPDESPDWELEGTVALELRYSVQPVLFFWRRRSEE